MQGKRAKKSEKPSGESANIAKDEDRVLMADMDDSSNADNEGELVGYFGEEDNEDFWFTDGKSNLPPSSTLTFDFVDSSDFGDNSGDLSDGSEGMPDLEDITDSSDDEENDVPLLKSFSETSENEDNLYYKVPEVSVKSVNLKKGYNAMPKLIPDYDNSEDGNFSGEFLDEEGDRLVKDLGGDAFMRTFTCAMLANTGRVANGVKTELYDSGTSYDHLL